MTDKNRVWKILSKIPVVNHFVEWLRNVTRPGRAWWYEVYPMYREYVTNARAIFFVLTPEHGNLGDHAIAEAIKKMLYDLDAHVIEISTPKLGRMRELGWLKIMNGKRIIINGGGNLGTLWFGVEQMQRDIISNNPKSTIFLMPNTIFYENTEWGRVEQVNSQRIYNAHNGLKLFARERASFELMTQLYNNVDLIPDMVLSLNESSPYTQRKGCLLCLRKDIERTLSDEEETVILAQVKLLFGDDVCHTDMVVNGRISLDRRNEELNRKFEEFRSTKLVITDRLHGMIFCAITGTPCIVVNSKSPKVRGCYEWIKDLEYVRFVNNVSDIAEEFSKIPEGSYIYDNSHLQHYYDELAEAVRQYI